MNDDIDFLKALVGDITIRRYDQSFEGPVVLVEWSHPHPEIKGVYLRMVAWGHDLTVAVRRAILLEEEALEAEGRRVEDIIPRSP